MTIMVVEPVEPSDEEQLWQDVREAEERIERGLAQIDRTVDQIYEDHLILGERYAVLRDDRSDQAFNTACALHRVKSTQQERTAAIWWASLDSDRRETLREEHPETLTLPAMRNRCGETHPAWTRNRRSTRKNSGHHPVVTVQESAPASRKRAKKRIPTATLSKKELRAIEHEAARAVALRRAETKFTAKVAKNEQDTRQSVLPTSSPVIAYDEPLWPKPANRHEYDDYDQLYWGCAQFQAFLRFIHEGTAEGRANTIRQLLGPTHKYTERRLREDKAEVARYLGVITMLCHLYQANPNGQCEWPVSDLASYR
jgi:hypothetical protein